MRLAVISDIHGNLEAFNEVLRDIDQSEVDRLICLGDNIGYGADPEAVVKLVCKRNIPSILGNHELALLDTDYLNWMNTAARRSIILTKELISSPTLDYIRHLKTSMVVNNALCVHGCPPDSPTVYLFQVSDSKLRRLFMDMKQNLCFVGHTHELEMINFDGHNTSRTTLNKGRVVLDRRHKYIISAGSVGQPRDGNNNAKYLIWDSSDHSLEVRFVPYDIASAAEKILQLGFPKFNARRLW